MCGGVDPSKRTKLCEILEKIDMSFKYPRAKKFLRFDQNLRNLLLTERCLFCWQPKFELQGL